MERGLAGSELIRVEVAQDVLQGDLGRGALDVGRMIEALAAAGVLGTLPRGHELLELGGDGNGVDHHVLGAAGVDHHAAHADRGLARAEALVVELAQGLAVDGVAVRRAELIEVQKAGAVTDLLVGHEGDLDGGVRELGFCHQAGKKRADLGHAGLVVCAQKRRAVGDHDVLSDELGQVGNLGERGLHGHAVDDAGNERAALVADDARLHAGGRGIGRGVDVGAEHERGGTLGARRRRQRGRHVGVVVDQDVLKADGGELLAEHAGHLVLARRGGRLQLVVGVGLGINLHVAQETLEDVAHLGGLSLPRINPLDSTAAGASAAPQVLLARVASPGREAFTTPNSHTADAFWPFSAQMRPLYGS